jgi:hypothetical protein
MRQPCVRLRPHVLGPTRCFDLKCQHMASAGAIRRRATMVRDNFDDRPLASDGLPLLVPPVQRRFDDLKQSK